MKGKTGLHIAGWVVIGLAAAAGLGLLLGMIVRGLWNALMPELFNLPAITYWQAVGLFILCHLFFKGPLGGGHDHGGPRSFKRARDHWRKGKFVDQVRSGLDEQEAAGADEGGA